MRRSLEAASTAHRSGASGRSIPLRSRRDTETLSGQSRSRSRTRQDRVRDDVHDRDRVELRSCGKHKRNGRSLQHSSQKKSTRWDTQSRNAPVNADEGGNRPRKNTTASGRTAMLSPRGSSMKGTARLSAGAGSGGPRGPPFGRPACGAAPACEEGAGEASIRGRLLSPSSAPPFALSPSTPEGESPRFVRPRRGEGERSREDRARTDTEGPRS